VSAPAAAASRRTERLAEAALVGIAAVWGLTFVMVQDAIEELPTLAFLAYRFIPAALLVAAVFRRRLGSLGRAGVRAGLAMGAFLTLGYVFQTLGLERTTASSRRCSARSSCASGSPASGGRRPRPRPRGSTCCRGSTRGSTCAATGSCCSARWRSRRTS
jgi:hypothetical protein